MVARGWEAWEYGGCRVWLRPTSCGGLVGVGEWVGGARGVELGCAEPFDGAVEVVVVFALELEEERCSCGGS